MRLFKSEKFFLIAEPKIEDWTYSTRLMLVLAALHERPRLDPLVPEFVYRHYHYLCARFPHCTPSFRTHPLASRFYPPSSTRNTIAPILGNPTWQSLNHRLLCAKRLLRCQEFEKARSALSTIKANLEYYDGFTPGYFSFLLTLADALHNSCIFPSSPSPVTTSQDHLNIPPSALSEILLGFDNVPADLQAAILEWDHGNTDLVPLPISPNLIRISVAITVPITNGTKNPVNACTALPLALVVWAHLSCPTTKPLMVRAVIGSSQSMTAMHMVSRGDENDTLAARCIFPKETLKSLPVGQNVLDLTVVVSGGDHGQAYYPVSETTTVCINLIKNKE